MGWACVDESSSSLLAKQTAAKWREYKHCRRVYGRNYKVSIVALTEFSRVNFH